MRGIIALFVTVLAATSAAQAQDAAPAKMGQLVGVLTRSDGYKQTTLITDRGALGFAVPGDWKEIQLDFKLPVATAVFDVPDPSLIGGGASNTNCSMAFADPAAPEGQAVISRVSSFGGADSQHNGWTLHTRTDATDSASPTVEVVAAKAQGFVTTVAMCAWSQGGSHDDAYGAYMGKLIDTLLDSVAAPAAPFKARSGETFFSPQ